MDFAFILAAVWSLTIGALVYIAHRDRRASRSVDRLVEMEEKLDEFMDELSPAD